MLTAHSPQFEHPPLPARHPAPAPAPASLAEIRSRQTITAKKPYE